MNGDAMEILRVEGRRVGRELLLLRRGEAPDADAGAVLAAVREAGGAGLGADAVPLLLIGQVERGPGLTDRVVERRAIA